MRLGGFLIAAILVGGCTVNVPNGTFNTQANTAVDATANTSVQAPVEVVATTTPEPVTPTPTPTPAPTATPATPDLQPSPSVSSGLLYEDHVFSFSYFSPWVVAAGSNEARGVVTTRAKLLRSTAASSTMFLVERGEVFAKPEDLARSMMSNQDMEVLSTWKFDADGYPGQAVIYIQYINGVKTINVAAYVDKAGTLWGVTLITDEPSKEGFDQIMAEYNAILNSWKWK